MSLFDFFNKNVFPVVVSNIFPHFFGVCGKILKKTKITDLHVTIKQRDSWREFMRQSFQQGGRSSLQEICTMFIKTSDSFENHSQYEGE